MGFLDKLFGRQPQQADPRQGGYQQGHQPAYPPPPGQPTAPGGAVQDAGPGQSPEDEAAIARYKYLLRTAPPEKIEQAHAEAFAKLTPEQRQKVLGEMSRTLPPHEVPRSDDPHDMARAATRAEMQRPGYMQQTFGRPGMGMGGVVMGSMLGGIAGMVIGSAIAGSLMNGFDSSPEAMGIDPSAAMEHGGGYEGDPGAADPSGGGDWGHDGGYDGGGSDLGGGFGDFGGDFGGGDFGGDF